MTNFNKELNISYIPKNTPFSDYKIILKHYFCSLAVYGSVILIYYWCPFFKNFLPSEIKTFYFFLYKYYIFIAPIVYFFYHPKSIWFSHNIEICQYIKRFLTTIFSSITKIKTPEYIKTELSNLYPTYREQQSLMLIFIKTFFGAIMLHGLFNNYIFFNNNLHLIKEIFSNFSTALINIDPSSILQLLKTHKMFIYNAIIMLLFTIDLGIFAIGYLTELPILKNKIRTVETTPAGILFCLICYHPFALAASQFTQWNRFELIPQNEITTPFLLILRITCLILLLIYVSASIALGTKASNLTNRGIVTKFPYNIVRHPAYVSKCTFWIIATIPFLSNKFCEMIKTPNQFLILLITTLTSIIFWVSVYYFRALTEERHLIKDPDYQDYVKKVKYRFIPKLF